MSDPLLILGTTCALLSAHTDVRPDDDGLAETVTLEVAAAGDGCHSVDVHLPWGVHLSEARARVVLWDDTRHALPSDRWEQPTRGLSGQGVARLYVPELRDGDRVVLEVTRHWPADARWCWQPAGAEHASLRLRGGLRGPETPTGGPRRWEVASPPPGASVCLDPTQPSWPTGEAVPAHALERLPELRLLPRAVDGDDPLTGPAAWRRGALDDRSVARTLVASRDGLVLGRVGGPEPWRPELAVATDPPTAYPHPCAGFLGGAVYTATGELHVPGVPPSPACPSPANGPVHLERHLILHIPDGDAQAALWPGGGSRVETHETVRFDADSRRTWVVPLQPDRTPVVATGPLLEAGGTVHERRDSLVVVAPPGETHVDLAWQAADAPAWGVAEPPSGATLELRVDAPGGEVRWEREAWWLAWFGAQPVLPDRERLVKALDYRFTARSMPEPALPAALKGAPPGWELAASLRPTLMTRVSEAQLPGSPRHPRGLHRARRTGAVTSVEAALILRLYALQAHMQATWVLVRPARRGPGWEVVPEGYDQGLLRIAHEGEIRWIDPTCTVCAPFELRPDLEGASALGPGVTETPPPTPGRLEVRVADGHTTAELAGPAALLLREALAAIPDEHRQGWLAHRFGGPRSTLLAVSGIPDLGEPLSVEVEGVDGLDPLALPRVEGESAWLPWVGVRVLDAPGGCGPAELTTEALAWSRTCPSEGRRHETLEVHTRRVPTADLAAVREARASFATLSELAVPTAPADEPE